MEESFELTVEEFGEAKRAERIAGLKEAAKMIDDRRISALECGRNSEAIELSFMLSAIHARIAELEKGE